MYERTLLGALVLSAGVAGLTAPGVAFAVDLSASRVQLGATDQPRCATAPCTSTSPVSEVLTLPLSTSPPPTGANHAHFEDKFYATGPGADPAPRLSVGDTSPVGNIGGHPALDGSAPEAVWPVTEVTVGQPVQFDVDGVHQVLVYRLTGQETYSQALETITARSLDQTDPSIASGDFNQVRLADDDRAGHFFYLGTTSVNAAIASPTRKVSNGSVRLPAGRYVAVCNVGVHFRTFNMLALLKAVPPGQG